LHISWCDEAFTSASLDSNAAATCRTSNNTHRFVLLLRHLHFVDLLAQLDQDLLQLLVLVSLLFVLLLKELLALRALLLLSISDLQVDLQDRAFIDHGLVEGGDLLKTSLKLLLSIAFLLHILG